MSTGRLESFSDGVIAVAITLLVLNIVVPDPLLVAHADHGDLARALGRAWPAYVAYAISFVTIGIIWINHHTALSRLGSADRPLMFINLLLLMSIVLLPFTTNLMATYLRAAHGEHLAAAIYGGSLVLMGVLFSAMNNHILRVRPQLLADEVAQDVRMRWLARSVSGVGPYVLATALAPLSPYLTLAITGVVAAFYALPIAGGGG